MKRVLVAVAAVLIIFLTGLFLLSSGCGRKQYVSFTYSFAISPKKGEVLKDVTVYLPFPVHNGRPMTKIYESLVKDYKKYWADEFPDARTTLINTKHGPMLKVRISKIDSRGFGLEAGYSFEERYSKEPIAPRFLLNPRLNPRKLAGFKTGYLSDSYVYADFKNAEQLGLALQYKIKIFLPSLLPLDYLPEDGYESYLGWLEPPTKPGSLVKYFDNNGWIEVPVSDTGYDKEWY